MRRPFQVLRTVNKEKDSKIVTVYGNKAAASVTNAAQLPYPYGSIIVMETAVALKDAAGKLRRMSGATFAKDKVTGLHVMRREKDFGAAYGPNRTAEWEYVEYGARMAAISRRRKSRPRAPSATSKAGAERDFVYRGRLHLDSGK